MTCALQDSLAILEDTVKILSSDMLAVKESFAGRVGEFVSGHASSDLDIYPVRYDDFLSGQRRNVFAGLGFDGRLKANNGRIGEIALVNGRAVFVVSRIEGYDDYRLFALSEVFSCVHNDLFLIGLQEIN